MKYVLLILSLFAGNMAMAQKSGTSAYPGQTSFFAELGGPGILFSANIDRRFNKSELGAGGRIGLGFITGDFYDKNLGYYQMQSIATFPMQLNYIFGKANSVHTFEVGAGITISGKKIDIFENSANRTYNSLYGTACFMYRRQPKDGGFSWRIGFTPIISGGFIQPMAGVSVGYNF
jgi:hypothetical protein